MSTATSARQHHGPDLLFVSLIHQALRIDAARLAAALAALGPGDRPRRVAGLGAFYGQYRAQLGLHHHHEDELFFPVLEARVGAEAMHLGELTAQHDALDVALQAVTDQFVALADPAGEFAAGRASAASALSAMTELLTAHLALEERYALPLFESEVPAAEYRKVEARARQATPRAEGRFLIPWVITHASAGQRTALLRSAPPLRLLYWLNLRYYRRFDQALVPAA